MWTGPKVPENLMQGAVLSLSADLPIYDFLKEALSRQNNLRNYVDALMQLKLM